MDIFGNGDIFDFISDESEEPIYHKCSVCGKRIVLGHDGDPTNPLNKMPICKLTAFNGCQVKIRSVYKLLENMHKNIIRRERKCNLSF